MRVLKLETPQHMTGADVFDWQTFLRNRNVFLGAVDSDFGPQTHSATCAYQTNAGLAGDGAVGVNTLAQALIDGYQSSMGANISGMDTRTDCTSLANHISSQAIKFVARYYSNNLEKALGKAEAQELSNAGLSIVPVFEDSNNSAGVFSTEAGQAQAAVALEQAAEIGQPAGTAIYFAVDYDAELAEVHGPVTDYFNAIKTTFSAAPVQYSVGVYGSGRTCRIIRDSGLAKFTWITGSIGFAEYAAFRRQADIVQLCPSRTLAGDLSIDDDIAQSAEFGAFVLKKAAGAISV